jgi:hypothetical protein
VRYGDTVNKKVKRSGGKAGNSSSDEPALEHPHHQPSVKDEPMLDAGPVHTQVRPPPIHPEPAAAEGDHQKTPIIIDLTIDDSDPETPNAATSGAANSRAKMPAEAHREVPMLTGLTPATPNVATPATASSRAVTPVEAYDACFGLVCYCLQALFLACYKTNMP